MLDTFYKALSGVSAAADAANHVMVAFAWAPHSTYGMNYVRSMNCQVAGGRLQRNTVLYGGETTRIQPALTFDALTRRFIIAWREQDFNTSINVAAKSIGAASWGAKVRPGARTHVAPGLAAPDLGSVALWYAFEGP